MVIITVIHIICIHYSIKGNKLWVWHFPPTSTISQPWSKT
jgi:hypothetical protein